LLTNKTINDIVVVMMMLAWFINKRCFLLMKDKKQAVLTQDHIPVDGWMIFQREVKVTKQ